MSDARGDRHDPATGEPIEPAETPTDEAAPVRGAPEPGADGAPADEPGASGSGVTEERGQGAPSGEPAESIRGGAEASSDAPAEGAADEPAAETAVYELDEDAPAAQDTAGAEGGDSAAEATAAPARGDTADEDASRAPDQGAAAQDAPTEAIADPELPSEPDYAALAAELEEFETRQSTGAGAAAATHTAPTTPGAGWFEEAQGTFKATEPGDERSAADDSPTEAVEPVASPTAVLPSEPASAGEPETAEDIAAATEEREPAAIFETYEPPRKRGNRVAALLIGVPAAIAFAVLYAVADLAWGWIQGEVTAASLADDVIARVSEPAYWIPVIAFFLAFWLVGVIVNRGRAGWWVILGFVVALVAYAAVVLAPVIAHPFWMMTPNDAQAAVTERLLDPVAIATFVIAREVTIWFGAWVAGRGRRMKRLNAEDRAEYEKAVADGD